MQEKWGKERRALLSWGGRFSLEVAEEAVEGCLVGIVVFPVREIANMAIPNLRCPGRPGLHHPVIETNRE